MLFCITSVQYKPSHGLWRYWITIVYEDWPEIILSECRTEATGSYALTEEETGHFRRPKRKFSS